MLMCSIISQAGSTQMQDIYTTYEGENIRDPYLESVEIALTTGLTYIEPVSDQEFNFAVKSHRLIRFPYIGSILIPQSEVKLNDLLLLEADCRWRRIRLRRKMREGIPPQCRERIKRAAVSGQSISGMIAAVILAKAGYEVHTFEIRKRYSRNIQWAIRASLVNGLAAIDQKLVELFKKIASPLYKGSIHIKNGAVRIKEHTDIRAIDPEVLPPTGQDMIKMDSLFTVEARVFEEELKKYLVENYHHLLHQHTEKMDIERKEDSFLVKNYGIGTCDLIVVAEGANSVTRDRLIKIKQVSERRWQIAGSLGLAGGGFMSKHWREEDGVCMLTGAIGDAKAKKIWIVGDVHSSFAGCRDQKRIDDEFRRLASLALQKPLEEIAHLEIYGPTEEMKITPFPLEQTLAEAASVGDNIILIGDAVGAGHWSAGGGLQIAVTCHAAHLRDLAMKLYSPVSKMKLINECAQGMVKDTKAWLDEGAKDFSPKEVQRKNMNEIETRTSSRTNPRTNICGHFQSPNQAC